MGCCHAGSFLHPSNNGSAVHREARAMSWLVVLISLILSVYWTFQSEQLFLLFIRGALQCMAAMPVCTVPPPIFGIPQTLPFQLIPTCLHTWLSEPLYPSSSQKVVMFYLLHYQSIVQQSTQECHSFCSVIPCGWNCTYSISVSEMLLNLYVAFISWEKSGTSGEKPRPRLCFHDKKDLAAVAVQEIPAFSCLLPFQGGKQKVIFNLFHITSLVHGIAPQVVLSATFSWNLCFREQEKQPQKDKAGWHSLSQQGYWIHCVVSWLGVKTRSETEAKWMWVWLNILCDCHWSLC